MGKSIRDSRFDLYDQIPVGATTERDRATEIVRQRGRERRTIRKIERRGEKESEKSYRAARGRGVKEQGAGD